MSSPDEGGLLGASLPQRPQSIAGHAVLAAEILRLLPVQVASQDRLALVPCSMASTRYAPQEEGFLSMHPQTPTAKPTEDPCFLPSPLDISDLILGYQALGTLASFLTL